MMRQRGFIMLSVILTMSLLASIALWLNHENASRVNRFSGQADTDRARYAAEAGLRALNAKVQDRNCAGSVTSVSNTDFGGGSYTASVTYVGPGGSPVTLVATGIYQGTSVTLSRPGTFAYPTGKRDYTLQPNGVTGIDTYLADGSASNFGSSDVMLLNSQNKNYFLTKFDLSAFPVGSYADELTLSVFAKDVFFGIGTTGYVYRVQQSWTENGANWLTRDGALSWSAPGGGYHPTSVVSTTVLGNDKWLDLDIADLGVAWSTGRYPNEGVLLRHASLGVLNLLTSDNTDNGKRPKLKFKYRSPCGTSGP